MLFPESQVRIWLYNRPCDMRKSYDGLSALAKGQLRENPLSGELFVFINHKLAQRPGSYVVLEYRRVVVKHKRTQILSTPPMPPPILDKCLADASLLAGMLVDKFSHHLLLYRQHRRMAQCGIQLSRTSLTTWSRRAQVCLLPARVRRSTEAQKDFGCASLSKDDHAACLPKRNGLSWLVLLSPATWHPRKKIDGH